METELSGPDSFSLSRFGKGAFDLFRAPKTTLRSMTKGGGYGKPLLYALLWQYVASAVALGISFVRSVPTPWGISGKILMFGLTPPLMLLVGFVVTGIFFVIWHLMGSSQNYQTAFRVWALFAPLSAFGALPYVSLAVMVYYFFLLVTASIEIHSIRPAKAWTVWGLLLAVFAFLVILAGVMSVAQGRFPTRRSLSTSSLGFPSVPVSAGQNTVPEDLEKRGETEMDRAREEFERVKKESQSTAPALKKEAPKK